MIALVVAFQMAVAPAAPADTGAIEAISAISAISADTSEHARTHRTHRTHRTDRVPEGDQWLGADKFKHMGMSYAITAYSFGVTDSEPAAIASAAVVGILKEVYDRKRGSLFSFRDLIWDAAGIGLGYAVIKQTR